MNNTKINIFQVKKEKDMDEILEKYKQTLVITMFVSSTCDVSKKFKSKFVEVAKQFNIYYFVYINVNDFENITCKYTEHIKETPTIIIFTNNKPIADYKGSCKDKLVEFIKDVEITIENAKKELEETLKYEEYNKKIYMLGKLDCIKELGIDLSREYKIDDNLTDMIREYNVIKEKYININNASSNISSHDNSNDNEIVHNNSLDKNNKKSAKIKEAETIMKLKQNIEMKQLLQLQQLKRICKLKKEANENNNKTKIK